MGNISATKQDTAEAIEFKAMLLRETLLYLDRPVHPAPFDSRFNTLEFVFSPFLIAYLSPNNHRSLSGKVSSGMIPLLCQHLKLPLGEITGVR
jgi:hypothetical protein